MNKKMSGISLKWRYFLGACIVVFLLGLFYATGRYVDGGVVASAEKLIFLFINGLPNFLTYPMIAIQYTGLLIAPIAAALVAVIYKKYLLAVLLLLIMPAKIFAEKIIKSNFQRERPKVYIDDAILRGDVQASGLSFTSGHAIIIFAIVTLATPFVPKMWRFVLWGIAIVCIIARMYLGAHLPLDVLGGAIIGVCIGLVLLMIHSSIELVLKKRSSTTADE